MNMDEPTSAGMCPAPAPASPEVFQQLGALTRQLHDTLNQLGVLPRLQSSVDNLPDARSRLGFIASKTEAAAERVLNLVDEAKADQNHIARETRRLANLMVADPVKAVASGAVMNFVEDVETITQRVDQHLTDIMMAQDFHDLTGQVVAKVVALATDLENQLARVLVQAAPPELAQKAEAARHTSPAASAPASSAAASPTLNGPVINPEGRTDVVANQGEVDDLLASLGF